MPNLQIDETIENTSFLRNCMNIHSIQHRKRLRKLHQHAPAKHHQLHRTAAAKPAGTSPQFFYLPPQRGFCMDNGIISSSYHHHIIIISSHHRRIITESPAHSQDNTPRKEGGL